MPTRITPYDGGFNAATSTDGRFVAYTGQFWTDDGESLHDVVLYDRTTGTSTRLTQSEGSVNTITHGTLGDVAISGDGRLVAFVSDVPELTPDDTDPGSLGMDFEDVYLHDVATGTTTRLNADGALDGLLGDRARVGEVALSADGARVAFVASDRFGQNGDVFVLDRSTGEARQVGEAGGYPGFDYAAVELQMTADGEHCFFRLPGTGPLMHVDVATGKTTALDDVVVRSEAEGDVNPGGSYAVSADGRLIAYTTVDKAGAPQIAVHDRQTGVTEQVTKGLGPNDGVLNPSISADGRFVLFAAEGLDVGSPIPDRLDLFVFDRSTGEVRNLTDDDDDHTPRPGSYAATISADNKTIVVETTERFDAGDHNEGPDLYVFDNPFAGSGPSGTPPVAQDDAFTVGEDEDAVLDVLANDADADGGVLTIVGFGGPAAEAGSLSIDGEGRLHYGAGSALQALAPGETGEDRFTYTVRDATGLEATASVTVTATGENDAPVLNPDVVEVGEDGTATVTAAQLTANDFDAEGGALRLVGVSGSAEGTVAFDQAAQSFTFTPDPSFQSLAAGQSATQHLSYAVRDAHGAEATATIVVNIVGANDAPVAAADALAIDEDATSDDLSTLLLGNDRDVDAGDRLRITAVDTSGTTGRILFDPATGAVRYEARGFDHLDPGQSALDRFTYTIRDASGAESIATATVTVNGQADGPVEIWGTEWDDLIEGTDADEIIHGLADDDQLYGFGGADVLFGGDGDDELIGGAGADALHGGAGNDVLLGDAADTVVAGGEGRDLWTGHYESETRDLQFILSYNLHQAETVGSTEVSGIERIQLWAGSGRDIIIGGSDSDIIHGGAGNDQLNSGTGGHDGLHGQDGDDTVVHISRGGGSATGGAGTDWGMLGLGAGDDVFSVAANLAGTVTVGGGPTSLEIGGFERVRLLGDSGNDRLTGGELADELDGGIDNDRLDGQGGDDVLFGGDGDDELIGGAGRDRLSGGAGNDVLYADGIPGAPAMAAATATADTGGDEVDGGAGADLLHAGSGAMLTGGAGTDRFVFEGADLGATVTDFGAGDALDVSALLSGATNPFATGHLRLEAREGGTALVLDADGAGGGAGLDLALLREVAPSSLTAASFVATAADGTPVVIDPIGLKAIVGTAGNDKLNGTAGADLIQGLGGNDLAWGKGGDDRIEGGAGVDGLFGGDGRDLLLGGDGWDALDGGRGDDRLDGGAGRDALLGGDGADALAGGRGDDALHGGAGNDRFVFAEGDGRDIIADFRAGRGLGDVIDLSGTDLAWFEELMAHVTTSRHGHAVIDLGDGDGLTLTGVRAGQLAADDFAFAAPDPAATDLLL